MQLDNAIESKVRNDKDSSTVIMNFEQNFVEQNVTVSEHFSTKTIEELEFTTLKDLKYPFIHYGKYLLCRTVVDPKLEIGITTIVEDVFGDVDELNLHNFQRRLTDDPDICIPKGTIMMIKEPYMKVGKKNEFIFVNSPTDVVFIDETDPILGNYCWQATTYLSSDSIKEIGNKCFYAKNYEDALKFYNRALNVEKKANLYLNCSAALLKLDRNSEAYANAKLSFELEATEKSLYRMGIAAYGMRNWQIALEHFQTLLKQYPSNSSAKTNIELCEKRLKETQGIYDINDLFEKSKTTVPRIDFADYTGPVEIKNIEGKGRGLIATKVIGKGDLILLNKAFSIIFRSENILRNCESDDQLKVQILNETIFQLKSKPELSASVYSLFSGDEAKLETTSQVGSAIDPVTLEKIIFFNGQITNDIRGLTKVEYHRYAAGLWILPSYINHECICNANQCFYGDMMMIRATRRIEKDEEITISYFNSRDNYQNRVKQMQKYKFICKCKLCELDKNDEKYLYREKLINECSVDKLADAIQLVENLRGTYEKRKELKLQMVIPLEKLSTLLHVEKQYFKAADALAEAVGLVENVHPMSAVSLIIVLVRYYEFANDDESAHINRGKVVDLHKMITGGDEGNFLDTCGLHL